MGVSVSELGEAVGLSVAGASCKVQGHVNEAKKWLEKGVMLRTGMGWLGGTLAEVARFCGAVLESGGAGGRSQGRER